MLTMQVQSSLDQLMQVVKKANVAETIGFYYVFEYTTTVSSKQLLYIEAYRDMVCFEILDESCLGSREISSRNTVSLTIEDISYEFIQAIEILYKTSKSRGFGGPRSVSYNMYCNPCDHVAEFFLNILYRECMNNCKITAEKIINLRYPFWVAILLGNAEVIEYMITSGCSVNSPYSDRKWTALIRAVQCMSLGIVKILISYGAHVDLADSSGKLPIAYYGSYCSYYSGVCQQPEIIKILLDKSLLLKNLHQKKFIRQFQNAFTYGNKEVIQIFLEYRTDIFDSSDEIGRTVLHYLSQNCHENVTEPLRDRKINVNVRDVSGCTPLYLAASTSVSHLNTIKFLLENGADVNAIGSNYKPLSVAVFNQSKELYSEIVKLFLEYNVDIQFVEPNQTTILDIVLQKRKLDRAEPFLAQLAILEEQGTHIKELIHNKIINNETFNSYFNSCKAELAHMRNNASSQNITLHMILVERKEKILKKCRGLLSSLSLMENLKSECHSEHAYYVTIKERVCSIVKSITLYQKALPVLCKLSKLKIHSNHLIIVEIANYLDDQDLQTLVEMDVEDAM